MCQFSRERQRDWNKKERNTAKGKKHTPEQIVSSLRQIEGAQNRDQRSFRRPAAGAKMPRTQTAQCARPSAPGNSGSRSKACRAQRVKLDAKAGMARIRTLAEWLDSGLSIGCNQPAGRSGGMRHYQPAGRCRHR